MEPPGHLKAPFVGSRQVRDTGLEDPELRGWGKVHFGPKPFSNHEVTVLIFISHMRL